MEKRRLIAIASSDYHFHNFNDFDIPKGHRFKMSLDAATYIAQKCFDNKVPNLFLGDLFHSPKEVDNEIISTVHQWYALGYEEWGIPFFGITGNHDQKQKNTLEHWSPTYLKGFEHFKTFTHLKNNCIIHKKDYLIAGVPYYTHEKDWLEQINAMTREVRGGDYKKILMLHGNAPGAKTPLGETIDDCILPTHLDKFFKHWDLVLFGHIHKPQKLSEKCYMIGSPIQQNRGDEGCEMGYWEVYSDMSMKFISLNDKFPTFITLKHGTEHTKAKDYITYVDKPGIGEEVTATDKGFTEISNRKGLSKAYMQAKGIKSKSKRIALTKILNEV